MTGNLIAQIIVNLIKHHLQIKTINHDQEILLPGFFNFQRFTPDYPVRRCPNEDANQRRCSTSIYRPGQYGGQ